MSKLTTRSELAPYTFKKLMKWIKGHILNVFSYSKMKWIKGHILNVFSYSKTQCY